MLGRKDYTPDELAHARTAVEQLLASYRALVTAVGDDPAGTAALAAFEPQFLNALTLTLDRYFVHRVRSVSGKDANPVTEVELLAEALLADDVLRTGNVVKYTAAGSVAGVEIGGPVVLDLGTFEKLATAFLAEIQTRFVG